jgi:hypothetical protein
MATQITRTFFILRNNPFQHLSWTTEVFRRDTYPVQIAISYPNTPEHQKQIDWTYDEYVMRNEDPSYHWWT